VSSLYGFIGAVPSLVFWAVVGVVAAARWSRHPTVSALVVTAAALHALGSVAGIAIPLWLMERNVSPGTATPVYVAMGAVGVASSLCLVVAALYGRQGGASTEV
jgi:hypothetical protein